MLKAGLETQQRCDQMHLPGHCGQVAHTGKGGCLRDCWETCHSPEGMAFLRPLKGKGWVVAGCIPAARSQRITDPMEQWKRNKKSRRRHPILPLENVEYFNKADFCLWLLRIMYQTQTGLIWSGPNADKYQEELFHWGAITLSCNTICPPGLEWERLCRSEQPCWIFAAKLLKERVSLMNYPLTLAFRQLDVTLQDILVLPCVVYMTWRLTSGVHLLS